MGYFRRLANHSLWALLSLLLTGLILFILLWVYASVHLPDTHALKDVHMQVPLKIYSKDHKLIAEFGAKHRIPITLNQVPKKMIQAFLATEDSRFFEHPGVDFIGLVRAAKAVILTGKKVQGASTITMQVARDFFLTRKKTFTRKFNEILLALKIDHEFSKQTILELYLNKIYLGERAYGVAAAAQVYYGKQLSDLSLPQIAMIAGLPQAPSAENPIADPKAAIKRRDHVLERMLELHDIDKKTYDKAKTTPLTASYHDEKIALNAPYVALMAHDKMIAKYGKRADEAGFSVYTTIDSQLQQAATNSLKKGLIAYTNRHGYQSPEETLGLPDYNHLTPWINWLKAQPVIDAMQVAAVLVVNPHAVTALLGNGKMITIDWAGLSWAHIYHDARYPGPKIQDASQILQVGDVIHVKNINSHWMLSTLPKVEGALLSLNPQNGAILAVVGGFNAKQSQYNRAIQASRQPGSSFKPFIYSSALAKGYTLASVINDAPLMMQDTGENLWWRPENDNNTFNGPTRLREGLVHSRNLVSIRLLQAIGVPYAIHYVRRFGFDPNTLSHNLSLALGSSSITPLQLAAGYSIFANGGYRVFPDLIATIVDQRGHIVYQADPVTACKACITNSHPLADQLPISPAPRVLTKQNAYLIDSALKTVITQGTGRRALILHRSDIAGKTGTTNKQMDAWFAGFNADVATVVWVGYDQLESLHEYGAQAALPIWIDFMGKALKGKPLNSMPEPSGLVSIKIDPKTGLLANPNQDNAIFELFRPQYEPTQTASLTAENAVQSNNVHQPNKRNMTNTLAEELF